MHGTFLLLEARGTFSSGGRGEAGHKEFRLSISSMTAYQKVLYKKEMVPFSSYITHTRVVTMWCLFTSQVRKGRMLKRLEWNMALNSKTQNGYKLNLNWTFFFCRHFSLTLRNAPIKRVFKIEKKIWMILQQIPPYLQTSSLCVWGGQSLIEKIIMALYLQPKKNL